MLNKMQRKHGDPMEEMRKCKIKGAIRDLIGELEFIRDMHLKNMQKEHVVKATEEKKDIYQLIKDARCAVIKEIQHEMIRNQMLAVIQ